VTLGVAVAFVAVLRRRPAAGAAEGLGDQRAVRV
jgi:hypothetical protein